MYVISVTRNLDRDLAYPHTMSPLIIQVKGKGRSGIIVAYVNDRSVRVDFGCSDAKLKWMGDVELCCSPIRLGLVMESGTCFYPSTLLKENNRRRLKC